MNLNRRKFLNSSLLGAGAIISSGLFSFRFPNSASPRDVDQYLEIVQATKINGNPDSDFLLAYEKHAARLLESGYQVRGEYLADNVRIFPFDLMTSELGIIDSVVLFFEKDETDSWRKTATLNGFQVEALIMAAQELNRGPEYFLPVSRSKNTPAGAIACRGAIIQARSYAGRNENRTELEVLVGADSVYSRKTNSNHLLSA